MFDKLSELENLTGLYLPDSPTQCVGFEVIDECDKVKHSIPVLSMAKTKSYNRVTEFVNNCDVLFFHKVDGITIVLEYDAGHLVSASTRGNGNVGKNILPSIKGINGIPLDITYNHKLTVIGEGFINIPNYENKEDQMEKLRHLGFAICEYEPMKTDFSKESISEYIKKLKEKAEKMNIPIDGIVITFNNVEFSKSLGRTSHHYNDSLAYKF